MAFSTTTQLLDDIRVHHDDLCDLFARRARIAESPAGRMMLRFLAGEQRRVSRVIGRFEQEAAPSTLGTWFGFTPRRPAHPQPSEVAAQMSPRELVAGALAGMPIARCFVVHGAPGWDEATPVGPFHLWEITPGRVAHRTVDPERAYGVARCAPQDLVGGESSDNAAALSAVFAGERGPHRDAILLNAALALQAARELSPGDAMALAADAVDSGRVRAVLDALRAG